MNRAEHDRPAVAVIGGGNGAFAVAADLGARGYRVRLLEDGAYSRGLDAIRAAGGIKIADPDPLHHAVSFAPIEAATYDPEEALDTAAIVLVVVPAYAEKRFGVLILPYLRSDQLVLFTSGTFGSALEFREIAIASGRKPPLVGESESLIVGGFKVDSSTVRLAGIKNGVHVAVLPGDMADQALQSLHRIYDDIELIDSTFQVGLGNLNMVLHPPVMVLNAGRIGVDANFGVYRGGFTREVAAVVAALDAERLMVASAMGLSMPSSLQRLAEWYPLIPDLSDLYNAVTTNPAYERVSVPATLDHRFLTEDVPFGLVPLEAIAALHGVVTPVATALIELTNHLLGRDVRAQGRTLAQLGLQRPRKDAGGSVAVDGNEGVPNSAVVRRRRDKNA